jgi:predicted cupin superfamily sugar epimerase
VSNESRFKPFCGGAGEGLEVDMLMLMSGISFKEGCRDACCVPKSSWTARKCTSSAEVCGCSVNGNFRK